MATIEKLFPLQGALETPCPECGSDLCYEECLHRNYVLTYVDSQYSNSERMIALIVAIANFQECLLKEMCEWELGVCILGGMFGLDCTNCDYYIETEPITDEEFIFCNGIQYRCIDPCQSDNPTSSSCQKGLTDFSQDAELLSLFEAVTLALKQFDGEANWLGVDSFIKAIFGMSAEVIKFEENTFFIALPVITDKIRAALDWIAKVLPLPLGTWVKWVQIV